MLKAEEKPLSTVQTPAARVIALFGGGYALGKIIKRHDTTIYKWTWPAERGGTGGRVPAGAQALLIEAASERGLALSYNDFAPQDGEQFI